MKKHSTIRTIYLYLFALIGLTLLVIGCVRLLNMGLKALIFTQAEQEQRYYYEQPPMPYMIEEMDGDECLTEVEKERFDKWLVSYEKWEENKVDPITSQRHRDAAISLALIIIGLPLYLFHWQTIKKDLRA